jgi:very-short-patch-repair endonuclease
MRERRHRLPVTGEAGTRARKLRAEATPAEQALWEVLRDRKLGGLKFRRQSPIGIFIADFHCRELNLVVELDGEAHSDRKQTAHDENRDFYLRSLGCTILRFSNQQVFEESEEILARIREAASRLRPTKKP